MSLTAVFAAHPFAASSMFGNYKEGNDRRLGLKTPKACQSAKQTNQTKQTKQTNQPQSRFGRCMTQLGINPQQNVESST